MHIEMIVKFFPRYRKTMPNSPTGLVRKNLKRMEGSDRFQKTAFTNFI